MKKYSVILLTFILLLTFTACELPKPPVELSDEEVVVTLLEAFRDGDYEGLTPYISDDNPLHLFFTGMDEEIGGDLAPAYQALHEQLKSLTFTAEAVEGKEAWGTVAVTLSIPDYGKAIYTAMAKALGDQVQNSGSAFSDMPAWLLQGVQGEGELREETFELHVGNRDGNMVMDTNTNRSFFAMLCGGLKPYLKASVTTCTFPNDTVWELLAQGDEIIAMLSTELLSTAKHGYTQAQLDETAAVFMETLSPVDGLIVYAQAEDGLLTARLGIDMAQASTFALNNLGLISDRITAGSNGWLSLDSTISSFTRDGASCETENFRLDSEE
ncbi:MAG: hypothetical protein HFI39_03845 [Lachnospiraceae bacterium]|nr:hypothetical protein [Lachnospiraceae bacterium]